MLTAAAFPPIRSLRCLIPRLDDDPGSAVWLPLQRPIDCAIHIAGSVVRWSRGSFVVDVRPGALDALTLSCRPLSHLVFEQERVEQFANESLPLGIEALSGFEREPEVITGSALVVIKEQ